MLDTLHALAEEMRLVARNYPFVASDMRAAALNRDKYTKDIRYNARPVRLMFTLDVLNDTKQVWHLSVSGEPTESDVQEIKEVFFPDGCTNIPSVLGVCRQFIGIA